MRWKGRPLLFFRDIKQDKLNDPKFKAFYDRECHICAATMRVVAQFLALGDELPAALDALGIPAASFDALKDGDHCDPQLVARLHDRMGLDGRRVLDQCPRAGGDGNKMTYKMENR